MSAAPGAGPDVCPVLAHDAAPTPAASPRIASVRQPMECTTNGLVAPPEGSRLTNRPRKREPRSGADRDYSAWMRPRSPLPFAGVAALLATAAGCSAPGHAIRAGTLDAAAGEAARIDAGGAVQIPEVAESGTPLDAGGVEAAPPSRGPAPATATARFPFPPEPGEQPLHVPRRLRQRGRHRGVPAVEGRHRDGRRGQRLRARTSDRTSPDWRRTPPSPRASATGC